MGSRHLVCLRIATDEDWGRCIYSAARREKDTLSVEDDVLLKVFVSHHAAVS